MARRSETCSWVVLARSGLLVQLRGSRIFFYRIQKATLDTEGWAWPDAVKLAAARLKKQR